MSQPIEPSWLANLTVDTAETTTGPTGDEMLAEMRRLLAATRPPTVYVPTEALAERVRALGTGAVVVTSQFVPDGTAYVVSPGALA